MSVSFFSNCLATQIFNDEPCLCSQMAPGWPRCSSQQIREHASPHCPCCGGTGFEKVPYDDGPTMNLGNANARLMLTALGLEYQDYRCTIHEARRAVIRANNLPLAHLVRHAERVMGTCGDAIVARVFSPEFTEQDLRDRIDRFAAMVEAASSRNASLILWG